MAVAVVIGIVAASIGGESQEDIAAREAREAEQEQAREEVEQVQATRSAIRDEASTEATKEAASTTPTPRAPKALTEEERKGFHCLSQWDGNHEGLEALVRDELNDPGSMKTYSTRITPVDENGYHTIIMDFGANNAFGGMVRNAAVGLVDNETCEAGLIGIE